MAEDQLKSCHRWYFLCQGGQMKKPLTFKSFLRNQSSTVAKKIEMDLPEVESWSELRIHVRRQGMDDDELVKVRALWRQYRDSSAS
jgi:hypothetical protein